MASISTTLRLTDQISAPIMSIQAGLSSVTGAFADLDSSLGRSFDTSRITGSNRAIETMASTTDRLGREISSNTSLQSRFNSSLTQGSNIMNRMLSTMTTMASTYLSMQGAKTLINLSDTMSSNTARLDNMNGNWGESAYSTEGLEKLIFDQAQNAGAAYQSMVEQVARFGNNAMDAFGSAEEVVYFTDLLNKQLINDGAFAQTAEGAVTQLAQALGSGVLMGDELVSLLEATPGLIQNVADYMGVAFGEVKGLASEGQVTADIVTGAMFAAADDINAKFETMPNTWARIWTRMQNQATVALEPVLDKLSEIANTEEFQQFTINLANGMAVVGNALVVALDYAIAFGNTVAENWESILPVVTAVVGAFLLYKVAMVAVSVVMGIYNVIAGIVSVANGILAVKNMILAGTFWAVAAPVLAVIGIIIAVIAVIGIIIWAITDWGETTTSTVGMICGAFAVAGAFIANIFIGLGNVIITAFVGVWNYIATFVNFFANVFDEPVASIAYLFAGLFDYVLTIVEACARGIDAIFGSNLAGAVSGWRGWIDDFSTKLVAESTFEPIMDKLNPDDYTLKAFDYGEVWQNGISFGEGLENGFSNLFNADDLFGGDEIPIDYSQFGNLLNNDVLDEIANNTGATASNTGSTADYLANSDNDWEFIRDLVNGNNSNQVTNIEIVTNMGGMTNTINKEMDLDGIFSALTDGVEQALLKSTESLHY